MTRRARGLPALAAAILALGPAAVHADPADDAGLMVFAAASLTDTLQEIGAAFHADTGVRVRFSFAASSALARQLESGAPARVFVSADVEWMDHLAARGLIAAGTRRNVAGNALVIVAPAGEALALEVAPGFPLAEALGRGRLAMADPDSVPAGRYAQAALEALGTWRDVQSRLAPAENVRAALALVSRGEAALGIVYATDARIDRGVGVVAAIPATTHPPIVYPAAAIAGSGPAADEFVAYLAGERAQAIFRRHGFTAPP